MSVRGISHVTFVVADLERTARLLCEGLGAREVYGTRAASDWVASLAWRY